MKSAIAITALVAMVAAQSEAPTGSFTAGAWNPLNRWAGLDINANGRGFWIGKNASSYCPVVENLDCSLYPGTTTDFAGGNDRLSLSVVVPGGQQVFVEADGALGYTAPHSASIPEGATLTGFSRSATALSFEDSNFKACPIGETEGVYQVFAAAVGDHPETCVEFEFQTTESAGFNAWEY